MSETSICMRNRLSARDCYYGGGLVNGARNVTLMGDCANRLMAREFGNIGRCTKVEKIRMYEPCFSGDYIEDHARLLQVDGKKVTLETRAYKIAAAPANPPFDSSIDVFEDPPIIMAMVAIYELP